MTSVDDIRAWDLAVLGDLAGALVLGADRIDKVLDRLDRTVSEVHTSGGRGPQAQRSAIADLIRRGRSLRNVADQVAESLTQLLGELGGLRDHAIRCVDDARAHGIPVNDAGEVIGVDDADTDAGPLDYHRSRVTTALVELARTDESGAQRLRLLCSVVRGLSTPTSPLARQTSAALRELVDATPGRRRSLIDGLTPESVAALVAGAPEIIGNLDGVPFDTRIAANRIAIGIARDDELQKDHPDPARARRYDEMLGHDRTFLAFSPDGNGRIIELIGQLRPGIPGIGVVVPGTGTNLSSSAETARSARALSAASRAPVIVYADGDLPQTLTGDAVGSARTGGAFAGPVGVAGGFLLGLRDGAADPSFAREMAPRLTAFGRELDIELARTAPGTPTTYIGHSYGGAVVGSAEQLGLRADRVVYASSAGTGVYGGDWHNPAPGVHRYSLTAPGDPIHLAQEAPLPFGGDPDDHPGVTRLDTGTYADGSTVAGVAGPYRSWDDPQSTAFANIAAVIAGMQVTEYVDRAPDLAIRAR